MWSWEQNNLSDSKTFQPQGRFSEARTLKLWNKKYLLVQSLQNWSKIELCSPRYGFIKIFWQIHLRDGHMKFMGKKIKTALSHEQNCAAWLVKNGKTVFSKLTENFVCQYQVSRQAITWPLVFLSQIFRHSPVFYVVILVEYPVIFIVGKYLMHS